MQKLETTAKKLVLSKETVRNLKTQTHIKAGAPASRIENLCCQYSGSCDPGDQTKFC